MQRISLTWVAESLIAFDSLDAIQPRQTFSDVWDPLYTARNQVENIFNLSVYTPYLRVSRQKVDEFYRLATAIIDQITENSEHQLTEIDVWNIKSSANNLKMIFLSELGTLPSFLITPKEGYDVEVLAGSGTKLFPPALLTKAPETEEDAMEAGKALAFELGTGCGFHTFRVTESVVRRYWDEVSGGKKRPNLETLGNFANEMQKQQYGDEKVIESIRQMNRLHRNPLIHPEIILTVEEAIGIVGIARSVIAAILAVLPDDPPTKSSKNP